VRTAIADSDHRGGHAIPGLPQRRMRRGGGTH
jgi:hypothetical protein